MSNQANGYNNYDFIQKDGYQIYSGWNHMFAGSGLAGELPSDITYEDVVKVLGEPVDVGGASIDRRWHLVFPPLNAKDKNTAGTIYTMYGDTKRLYVGGFRSEIADRIVSIFK